MSSGSPENITSAASPSFILRAPASLPFPTLVTFQSTAAFRSGSALKLTNPAGPPTLHFEHSAWAGAIVLISSLIGLHMVPQQVWLKFEGGVISSL